MAALATQGHTVAERSQGGEGGPRLFEPRSVTLEDAILAIWQDLVAEGRAGCPVCGGSISVEGGCAACGSELG
jgi:hypothetical protein